MEGNQKVHRQIGHQRMACGAPFQWDAVTIRPENVTCEACRDEPDRRKEADA